MTRATAAAAIVAAAAVVGAYLLGADHGGDIVRSYLGPADMACNTGSPGTVPECWSLPVHP